MNLSTIAGPFLLTAGVLLGYRPASAQAAYRLPNEEIIFAFKTKTGKQAALVRGKGNQYLQYRFGTPQQIELEYPAFRNADSWKQFIHSGYERGGGIQNEGMSLQYVRFSNNRYRYTLYQTYYARGNQRAIGIKVTHLVSGKTTTIAGLLRSQQGSLLFFQGANLIPEADEIFE